MGSIKLLLLILGISLSAFSAQAQNLCLDIFSNKNTLTIQYGPEDRYKDAENFAVEILPSRTYSFQATLNAKGTLNISAFLALPEFGVRSHLKGPELYAEMIQHFGRDKILRIEGTWVEGTNHSQFFAALKRGFTPEQAALATWSGRQAQLYGFTRVEMVEVKYDNLMKDHTVKAIFVRP